MGILWDKITSQLIEIIEWLGGPDDLLVWRFPVRAQEIKNGAKLIVREGQQAVFVNEGKLADVFGPGTYTLSTQNLPILSTLKGWKYGFNSPFKAEVYFVKSTDFMDLKWGTPNPIMVRDPEFGPVRIRGFGVFALKVSDPATFMRKVVGTDGHFEIEDITGQLKKTAYSRFSVAIGQAKIPILDMAGNLDELSRKLRPLLEQDFAELGLSLTKFMIENISLPPEVEKVLDKRSEMSLLGNVQQYAAYQAANAIPDAARTPNSLAGAGMGLAAGWAMGNQMAQAFVPQQYGPPGYPPGAYVIQQPGMQPGMQPLMHQSAMPAGPHAAPTQGAPTQGAPDMVTRLKKLDGLKAAGVLSDDEYNKKRTEILSEI